MAALLTYSFLPHTEILLELYTHTYIHRERWEEVDVCVYFQGKEIYYKQERLNFRKINVFHIFPIKRKRNHTNIPTDAKRAPAKITPPSIIHS